MSASTTASLQGIYPLPSAQHPNNPSTTTLDNHNSDDDGHRSAASLVTPTAFTPDTPHLVATLNRAFLSFDRPSVFLDTEVRCTDGAPVHVSRPLLMARSPYLYEHLAPSSITVFGVTHPDRNHDTHCNVDGPAACTAERSHSTPTHPFAEPMRHRTLTLPLSRATFVHVLHYVYTADVPLAHHVLAVLNAAPPHDTPSTNARHALRTALAELVDLARAADLLGLPRLQRVAADLVSEIAARRPRLACVALDAAVRHRDGALQHCDQAEMWRAVLRDQRLHFGPCDGPGGASDSGSENHKAGSGDNGSAGHADTHSEHAGEECDDVLAETDERRGTGGDAWECARARFPVLDLSADTLSFLVRTAPPGRGAASQTFFHALYVWASRGQRLREQACAGGFTPLPRERGMLLLDALPGEAYWAAADVGIDGGLPADEAGADANGKGDVEKKVQQLEQKCTGWKTEGQQLHQVEPARVAPQSQSPADRQRRWKHAIDIAALLDVTVFDPHFLVHFAEASMLVRPRVLFEAYRTHLLATTAGPPATRPASTEAEAACATAEPKPNGTAAEAEAQAVATAATEEAAKWERRARRAEAATVELRQQADAATRKADEALRHETIVVAQFAQKDRQLKKMQDKLGEKSRELDAKMSELIGLRDVTSAQERLSLSMGEAIAAAALPPQTGYAAVSMAPPILEPAVSVGTGDCQTVAPPPTQAPASTSTSVPARGALEPQTAFGFGAQFAGFGGTVPACASGSGSDRRRGDLMSFPGKSGSTSPGGGSAGNGNGHVNVSWMGNGNGMGSNTAFGFPAFRR